MLKAFNEDQYNIELECEDRKRFTVFLNPNLFQSAEENLSIDDYVGIKGMLDLSMDGNVKIWAKKLTFLDPSNQ